MFNAPKVKICTFNTCMSISVKKICEFPRLMTLFSQ